MADFNPGDTVRLKSGGPLMTVENVGEYMYQTKVKCTWFEGTKVKEGLFVPQALMLAS